MTRTFVRQDTQVRKSELYVDNVAPTEAAFETNPVYLQDDMTNVRSQLHTLLKNRAGNWWDDLNVPTTLDTGSKRGVNDLNTALHAVERKRVQVYVAKIVDITVPSQVKATGTFASTGVFSDGETVTIGAQTYTFKSPFVDAANNIDASGTTAQTHENLRRAINNDGVAGVNYGTGTGLNADVTAADTATTNVLTAKAFGTTPNAVATTTTCANATFSGNATLINGAGDVVILGVGELPAPIVAAVGNVTTEGTIVAYLAGFGIASLTEIGGSSNISPWNLYMIVDADTRDPILSGGRTIYALGQYESAVDGSNITINTPNRAQLSFVRINATGDDLELVPVADIQGKEISYTSVKRVALLNLTEQDFLRGAEIDVPSATTVTRQLAYTNQGAVPVDVVTDSYLDLEGVGVDWIIRDNNEANLLSILEGSAGGTSTVEFGLAVDVFDNNAVSNDFASPLTVDSSGTDIEIGVTAGQINTTGAADFEVQAAGELYLDDGNRTASDWATDGIKLSEDDLEWDAMETAFGEVSLFACILKAYNSQKMAKADAQLTANINANVLITGAGGGANITTQMPSYKGLTFVDAVMIYINGILQRNGANAGTNNDVYPSAVAGEQATGDFYCEYNLLYRGGTEPDVIQMIVFGNPTP